MNGKGRTSILSPYPGAATECHLHLLQMIPVAPCAFFVSEGLHEPFGLMREYSLPIIVINDLSLSLYRMLAELCNTKNSRYFES